MKNLQLTLLGCLLLITSSLSAQRGKIEYLQNFDKRKIHFGFYLGLNINYFKVDYNEDNIRCKCKCSCKRRI